MRENSPLGKQAAASVGAWGRAARLKVSPATCLVSDALQKPTRRRKDCHASREHSLEFL